MKRMAVPVLLLLVLASCQTVEKKPIDYVADAHSVYNAIVKAYLSMDDAGIVPDDVKATFNEAEQIAYKALKVADAALATGQDFDISSLDDALEVLQALLTSIMEVARAH